MNVPCPIPITTLPKLACLEYKIKYDIDQQEPKT